MLSERIRQVRRFVEEALGQWNMGQLSALKRGAVRVIQIVGVSVQKLRIDNCLLQASALSYITVVAMVPVLAIAFAISSAFGAQEHLIALIEHQLAGYPEQFVSVITHITETIRSANYGALGGVGGLVIFLMAVRLLSKIENTFNTIWEAESRRAFLRRIADYISVVVIVPLLLITATSAGTFLASEKVETFISEKVGALVVFYHCAAALGGFIAVIMGFAFLYLFMPNVRVRFRSAVAGGFVAGLLWAITQWGYVGSQVGMTRLNPVYGSFAAVPLFLGWVFISWVIVLIGAELSFAVQNHIQYTEQIFGEDKSVATRQVVGLLVMHDVCSCFLNGEERWSMTKYQGSYAVPYKTLAHVVKTLEESELVLAVNEERDEFVPGRDLGHISAADVVKAIQGHEVGDVAKLLEERVPSLCEIYTNAREQSARELDEIAYRDLLQQGQKCEG